MKQGKLEVVKQEIARVNIDMSRIRELKWAKMGEFNSDDHYIYYCGQEFPRRNGVTLMVKKRGQNAVLWCNLKNNRMISVSFQGKSFNITVVQVCASTPNAKENEFYQLYEVFLPGKSHGWRNLVGYSPWGRKELDTIERLHFLS